MARGNSSCASPVLQFVGQADAMNCAPTSRTARLCSAAASPLVRKAARYVPNTRCSLGSHCQVFHGTESEADTSRGEITMPRYVGRGRSALRAGNICVLAFLAVASSAQSPYSGRAGLIFHVEREAQVVGESEPVSSDKRLRHLEAGERLRTQEARVEVILAPGLILRVGENTEFEMVKAHLSDLTVRMISGSAILHVVSGSHSGSLSVLSGDKVVKFQKLGVYRLDVGSDKSLGLKVFGGQAVVSANGFDHKVKKKWSLELADPVGRPLLAKFDRSRKDSLDEWHRERKDVIAAVTGQSRSGGDYLSPSKGTSWGLRTGPWTGQPAAPGTGGGSAPAAGGK